MIVIGIFLNGCTEQIEKSNEEQQLANPASVYCVEQGGTLRMEENEAGQYGMCTLPDGTKCEEWAYYRGECPEEEVEIFCPNYDGNQEECITHSECKWTSNENICEPIEEAVAKESEEETPKPILASYQIKDVPYYMELGFCYGGSAMMILMYNGFTEEQAQEYRTIVKTYPGGPPDIFSGFMEVGVLEEIKVGYSKNYNKEYADFYNGFLDPEQTILFDKSEEAFEKLKKLISADVPVILVVHNGNHYVVAVGYDNEYIYTNDPGLDNAWNYKIDGGADLKQRRIPINSFFDEWSISGQEKEIQGNIGFPGDQGMIWLEQDEELDEDDEGDEEKMVFASELEKDLPNTPSNEICKKLPLTEGLSSEEILTLTPGDRQECLAIVNNNPEFCELIELDSGEDMLGNDDKNVCLAHAKKDVSYCKLMSENGDKKHCYFGLSLISGDIDVCDEIDYDENERQLCYWSFVNALYWEDKSDKITTEHCNKLPAGSQSRDSCLAQKEGDVSLCKGDFNCLTLFEQPMSFCEGEGKSLKYCIRDRAMTSKDLSICETLTGAKRDDCIGDFVGHISLDISTCDKITGYFARNTCYKDVAIQSGTNFLFNLYN